VPRGLHRHHPGHRRGAHRLLVRRVPVQVPGPAAAHRRAGRLMDAEILTVGTELLLGFTVNGNAAVMGALLADAGVRVRRAASVADEPELIAEAVKTAL